MKQTAISSVGEFGLIDTIRRIVGDPPAGAKGAGLIKGIGDDAAVYRPAPGKLALLTTDALVEGVHFDLTFTAMKHLGWKAMAANLSDIAAMGGEPRIAVISLSLPAKISVEMVEDFYGGVAAACREYGCALAGGDTTASVGNMTIAVSVTGDVDESRVKYRSGAKAGELFCVTGHLGASVAGLKVLQREKARFAKSPDNFQPNLSPYTPAVERHLVPRPRLDLSKILVHDVVVSAMIDISDGLASEVRHICEASGTGASLFEHNVPVVAITQKIAEEIGESAAGYALYGGEEYELLFTISDGEFEKLARLTSDVTIVGRVEADPAKIELVRENGEREPLRPAGWNHFPAS